MGRPALGGLRSDRGPLGSVGQTHRGVSTKATTASIGGLECYLWVKETLSRNPELVFSDPVLRFVLVRIISELKTALELNGCPSSGGQLTGSI